MTRKISAAVAVLFGFFAAVSLFLYITTCAWLIKELLIMACIMLSCFGFGLYLGQACKQ